MFLDDIHDRILVFDDDASQRIAFHIMSDDNERNMIVLDRTDFISAEFIIIDDCAIDMGLDQRFDDSTGIFLCSLSDENRGDIFINLGDFDHAVQHIGNIRIPCGRDHDSDIGGT